MPRSPRRSPNSARTPFQVAIDAAESTDALKLEVTAPTIAPSPSSATKGGVASRSSSGSACAGVCASSAPAAAPHGNTAAARPSTIGGATSAIVTRPAATDVRRAWDGVEHARTRWK